jgi:hypothetical protein
MFVRDSAIARIFLGPTVYFQQKNIFYIAGQLPVLFYDFNDPNYQFGINGANGLNNPVFTGPNPPPAANTTSSPPAVKEKIPRPPNAFILYRKFHHPSVVAQNPGIHNNVVCKFCIPNLHKPFTDNFKLRSLGRCGAQRHLRS